MHGNILQHSGAPERRRLRATRRLGGWVVGWGLQIWSEEACGGVLGPISVTDHLGWVVCVKVGLDLGVCWRVLCREELLGGMLGSWNFF